MNYTRGSAGGSAGDCQAPLKHFSQTISSDNYDINIINFNLNIIINFNRNFNRKTNRKIDINFNLNGIINFIDYSTDAGCDSDNAPIAGLIVNNTKGNPIDNDGNTSCIEHYCYY